MYVGDLSDPLPSSLPLDATATMPLFSGLALSLEYANLNSPISSSCCLASALRSSAAGRGSKSIVDFLGAFAPTSTFLEVVLQRVIVGVNVRLPGRKYFCTPGFKKIKAEPHPGVSIRNDPKRSEPPPNRLTIRNVPHAPQGHLRIV